MALVITNCGKRKRVPVDPTLHAAKLASASSDTVASDWSQRLTTAEPTTPVEHLYAGRAFYEAVRTAKALSAPLAVVSAGLGLVDGRTRVPSYSLTTVARDPDNILNRTGSLGPEWWSVIRARSPFHSTAPEREDGVILAALSSGYLSMVAPEWADWPRERLARLRLFTKALPASLPDALAEAWMPYDDRLEALGNGHAGTLGDFAPRAMRHFAENIFGEGDQASDRAAVLESLEGLTPPNIPTRTRHTDEEIKVMIGTHWDLLEGRSAAMLRHLRDTLGVACEQKRFQGLFAEVAGARRALA